MVSGASNLVDPASASLEMDVGRLRRVQAQGRHDEALEDVRCVLADHPENRDLLLIEAIALRHLGRIDEALTSLDRLAALQPRFSLMYQERGLCQVARKDATAAITALLQAVNLNPALPMSWRMLEGVYRIVGDGKNAATAGGHVETLRQLPSEVVTATSLYFDNDLVPAESVIRAFLRNHGDHPEAMRLLAKIGMAFEIYDDAEVLLAGVLAMEPDHRAARFEYALTLSQRHKHAEAEGVLAPLLADDPANTEYRRLASTIAVGLGQQEKAIALYRSMLADLPGKAQKAPGNDLALASARADLNLWMGHALKTVGELPSAIDAYRTASAERPDFGDAWWSLANLKTYRFTDAEINLMRAGLASPATTPADRVHLSFALGKALEDQSDFVGAWNHYAQGNAEQRARSQYRAEVFEINTREQTRVCTPAFFAERDGWGCQAPDPIFIVGLPRSGSTLIEQILASHEQVEGTQELPDIQRLVLELQGRDPDLDNPRYPQALIGLSAAECNELGERYLASTRVHRSDRRFFIDKMPNNFRHVGLIRLILPRARIIDARRHPMACCFSNLKQLFAQGQEFTYSIPDIARYYRTYLELMRYWDRALPGHVLRVVHEDVIEDLEIHVRRILNHCGLPFDPACVAFHETKRSVRTPSSEQVRQPIFRDGLEQWRRFEAWLDPLKDALGEALNNWRD